jgi:hypothetical protein
MKLRFGNLAEDLNLIRQAWDLAKLQLAISDEGVV